MNRNIAIVISDLGSGGAQKIATSLARYLSEKGNNVTFITLSGPEDDFFEVTDQAKRIALNVMEDSGGSALKGLCANWSRIRKLRGAIRKSSADTVIAFIAPTNILTILACMGLEKHLIISERNDPARQSLGRLWDGLRRLLYARADIISANSQGAIDTMKAYVPESKLRLIPNHLETLDPKDITPPDKREKLVLCVGRLHQQKAMDVLIDAFIMFHENHSDWELVILGEGELRDQLQSQIDTHDMRDHIHLKGRVSNPQDYYNKAAIFVLASRHEGTPNALLEAMNSGVAPIVSNACDGALPFVKHEESGLVFPVDDVKALTTALTQLANDQSLRSLCASGAQQAVSVLHEENTLPAWEKLINMDGNP